MVANPFREGYSPMQRYGHGSITRDQAEIKRLRGVILDAHILLTGGMSEAGIELLRTEILRDGQ